MLKAMIKTAQIETHPEEGIIALSRHLPVTYQPVVQPLVERQTELFGIPSDGLGRRVERRLMSEFLMDAEIFVKGSTLIIVQLFHLLESMRRKPDESDFKLRIYYVTSASEIPDFSDFESAVESLWSCKLAEAPRPLSRIREFENSIVPDMPSSTDLKAAAVLSDRSTRTLAIAIKASSGLLLGDVAKQLPSKERSRVDDIVQSLIADGIVETEIVVICSKTGAQVNRAPSLAVIETLEKSGLKCACGKNLSQEKTEKALTVTDFGRALIDGSRWLSCVVLQVLVELGVPIDSIRMEQRYSGEEIDCIRHPYRRTGQRIDRVAELEIGGVGFRAREVTASDRKRRKELLSHHRRRPPHDARRAGLRNSTPAHSASTSAK